MRQFNLDEGVSPLLCSIEGWGAAIGLGIAAAGTVVGAEISGSAAQGAAQTQATAANDASQVQLQMFDTTQKNLAPYMTSGTNALAALDYGLGIGPNKGGTAGSGGYGSLTAPFTAADYQKSPAYNFQFSQGQQAVQNSASAAGGIGGGNTLQALTSFGQGLANTDYYQAMQAYTSQQQQRYGMLSNTANSGQNAAANLGGIGTAVGGQIGANTIGAGNALAAGQIGVANAASGGINSLAQIANLYGNGSQGASYPFGNNPYTSTGGGAPGQWEQNYNPTGVAYCDYALKDHIEPYRFHGMSGLMTYKFRYKGDDKTHIGVIAQEAREKYPEAVFEGPRGYLMVDYKRIPSEDDWAEIDSMAHEVFA